MTKLVLVHGINQEGKSSDLLKQDWLGHLCQGLGRAETFANFDVSVPFYGDELKRWAAGDSSNAISQGADGRPDQDEATFLAAGLMEAAESAGIGSAAIASEQRTIAREQGDLAQEQSFVMNRRFNAIVRLLERVSPLHGTFVMRVLKQAYAYLKKPGVGTAIDDIVRPTIESGPVVIVAHSLGTVVSFKLLREMALAQRPVDVPLFVTVGSPLPLMAVQAALGPAFSPPMGVKRWLNAIDPDDFITLGKGLDENTFSGGIENLLDIENDQDNAHSISGYLSDPRVAVAVADACRG